MNLEIISYTIIRTPPEGFEGAPYCVAIVNNGVECITARIAGYKDGKEVRIGENVIALDEPDVFGAIFRFAS